VAHTTATTQLPSYDAFFGFHEPPFGLAPNTRFRFESASHEAALAQVTHALQRRETIVVVTGDIGTGKTLLCRTVVERLDRKTFLSVIADPMLGRDDLLTRMLQDFGIISKNRAQIAPAPRADLIHALNEFLQSLAPLGAHAVVVLDEAQHAQADVLEEIRLLSNAQDERGTMLQILLVGQHDLSALLGQPELRQLRERVSRQVRLEPLTPDEVRRYIEHRIAIAREPRPRSTAPGARELARALADWNHDGAAVTFAPDAVERVVRISQGIPRRINLLCDRALEYAFAAQSRIVDAKTIDSAAAALQLSNPIDRDPGGMSESTDRVPSSFDFRAASRAARRDRWVAASIAVGVVLIIAATWFGVQTMNRSLTNDAAPAAASSATPNPAPANVSPPATPARTAPTPQVAEPARSQPEASAPARPALPTDATSDRFDIVVASFRTSARASEVAGNILALGEPVRQRVANGWHQVVAGPFPSRADADQAQQRLQHAGFSGSQIVAAER
jgi:general secretion pathway protein A